MANFESSGADLGRVHLGSLFYSQEQLTTPAPTGPSQKFGHIVNYGGMLSRFNHQSHQQTFAVQLDALSGLGALMRPEIAGQNKSAQPQHKPLQPG